MQTNLTVIIRNALNAAHSYGDSIQQARISLNKCKSSDEIRTILLPIVADYYSVPVIEGERKAKGTKVLDKTAVKYEAAKKSLQRLVGDIVGDSAAKKEEIEVPRHIAALAAQLAKACMEYEQARRIASTALSGAFAG